MGGICAVCGTRKSQFLRGSEGAGLINKMINRLPMEMHLPGHNFTGPGTQLHKRLNADGTPKAWSKPINRVDQAAYRHDLCYAKHKDTAARNSICDKAMLASLDAIPNPSVRERMDRSIVKPIIGTKARFGLGIKKKKIRWSDELAEELHKPIRRKFQKRRVVVGGVDETWAADLVDMSAFSRDNRGFKFLLSIIDIFSKYGWLVPLKDKKGTTVRDAFRTVFKDRTPKKLWTDKGSEFYNREVKELLQKHGVEIYSTENEEKSSVVERWNRTMKEKMFKYFSANSTRAYLPVLDDLVRQYNTTKHRSIKMTPVAASQKDNEAKVFWNLYGDLPPMQPPRFKVGDKVRITKKKGVFEKGYTPRWTEEVFTISQTLATQPPTYRLKDYNGEEIKGSFYEPELQRTDQDVFRIEKVLRRRTRGGVKEIYVKWRGYPKTFNSWLRASELQ